MSGIFNSLSGFTDPFSGKTKSDSRILKLPVILAGLFFFFDCTTVGFHITSEREKINFGPPATMKVCFLREKDVTDEEIKDLLIAWATELMFYNIIPEKAIVSDWKRGGYWGSTISQQLQLYPLRPPCDRIVALVGRSPVDIVTEIFSLILFAFVGFKLEIHGAVDGYTHTRGYILSKYTTLFQLITGGPKSTLIHEGYHLLGCGHSLTLTDCYKQIHFLKEAAAKAKMDGSDFFPAITTERELFLLREGVNRRLGN